MLSLFRRYKYVLLYFKKINIRNSRIYIMGIVYVKKSTETPVRELKVKKKKKQNPLAPH